MRRIQTSLTAAPASYVTIKINIQEDRGREPLYAIACMSLQFQLHMLTLACGALPLDSGHVDCLTVVSNVISVLLQPTMLLQQLQARTAAVT